MSPPCVVLTRFRQKSTDHIKVAQAFLPVLTIARHRQECLCNRWGQIAGDRPVRAGTPVFPVGDRDIAERWGADPKEHGTP